jgi:hypothetical protein
LLAHIIHLRDFLLNSILLSVFFYLLLQLNVISFTINLASIVFKTIHFLILFCKTSQPDWTWLGRDGPWKRFVLMKLISLGGAIMGPKWGKLSNLKTFSSRENRNVIILLYMIIMPCRFRLYTRKFQGLLGWSPGGSKVEHGGN